MKCFLVGIIICSSFLAAQEYHVNKSKENIVKFISDAPLEDFEGVTDYIDGYMYLKSLTELTDNQLYFEVDLTTLDTGIDLRNRHMRENYLETDKYRFTFFEGKIDKLTETSQGNYEVEVSGKMFIHGVTKDITVTGKLNQIDKGFRVESDFSVALSDYEIDIPQLMFMKIDENMKLQLKFYLEKFTQTEE